MKSRKYLITLLLLCSVGAYSQTRDAVLNKITAPNGVKMVLENDTNYFDDFHKRAVGITTFSALESSVYYFVFPYTAADSLSFYTGLQNYRMSSNCVLLPNADWNKNFTSFKKNNYYFLLQMCPCRSVEHPGCGILAEKLNAWRKEK